MDILSVAGGVMIKAMTGSFRKSSFAVESEDVVAQRSVVYT